MVHSQVIVPNQTSNSFKCQYELIFHSQVIVKRSRWLLSRKSPDMNGVKTPPNTTLHLGYLPGLCVPYRRGCSSRKKVNPYAAGGYFCQYKMMQKGEKCPKPWQIGTHLRVLSEGYPMSTNMPGFRWYSKIFASLRFGRK